MPKSPTKPAKFKSKKALTKFYITSEVFNSADLPSFVTELCNKERAVYRVKTIEDAVDKDELKRAQEIVRTRQKLWRVKPGEEPEEVEMSVIEYDIPRWRHYFQPESVGELVNFMNEIGFELTLTNFDPEENEGENLEKWVEFEIGSPLPEEPVVVAQMVDAFMVEDSENGECDDPECDCHKDEDE